MTGPAPQVAGGILEHITSRDGTSIGYWRSGQGSPLVLVHGSTADHTRWRPVLPLLEPHLSVYAVDRRGRGASGDGEDYAVEREFADIAAVVDAVADATGGAVDLLGHSYGAVCALDATLLTAAVRRMVLYEPPVLPPPRSAVSDRLVELLAQGRRAELVETFFRDVVGMPQAQLKLIKSLPSWGARVAAAHTIVREERLGDGYRFESARFAAMTVPTLLLAGADSPQFLQASTAATAAALPAVRVVTLAGQGHIAIDTVPERFAAEVLGFLQGVAS